LLAIFDEDDFIMLIKSKLFGEILNYPPIIYKYIQLFRIMIVAMRMLSDTLWRILPKMVASFGILIIIEFVKVIGVAPWVQ
jgi:hypothetical protein